MTYAELAVGSARQDRRPYFVASGLLVQARTEQVKGKSAAAIELVESVLHQSREMGWHGIESEAKYLLGELKQG